MTNWGQKATETRDKLFKLAELDRTAEQEREFQALIRLLYLFDAMSK